MIGIALLPGDGIGEEILAGPQRILKELEARAIARGIGPLPIGARAHSDLGQRLPDATRDACDAADAILLGAVGEHPGISMEQYPRPELALVELRQRYDLRVSVREVLFDDGHISVVIRNLLEGAYVSDDQRTEGDDSTPAVDQIVLRTKRIEELAAITCDYARKLPEGRRLSVDKANLLATSRLWRRVVTRVAADQGIAFDHIHVDRAAYELVRPGPPPVLVLTEGLFGDILSDLLTGRAGSPALCSSASVRPGAPDGQGPVGLFEPAHGSAPRRAGRDQANPIGAFLSLAMLLSWFPSTEADARVLREAIRQAQAGGPPTYDLAAPGAPVASTSEFSDRVVEAFVALQHG